MAQKQLKISKLEACILSSALDSSIGLFTGHIKHSFTIEEKEDWQVENKLVLSFLNDLKSKLSDYSYDQRFYTERIRINTNDWRSRLYIHLFKNKHGYRVLTKKKKQSIRTYHNI
jgi:hypothetical protein